MNAINNVLDQITHSIIQTKNEIKVDFAKVTGQTLSEFGIDDTRILNIEYIYTNILKAVKEAELKIQLLRMNLTQVVNSNIKLTETFLNIMKTTDQEYQQIKEWYNMLTGLKLYFQDFVDNKIFNNIEMPFTMLHDNLKQLKPNYDSIRNQAFLVKRYKDEISENQIITPNYVQHSMDVYESAQEKLMQMIFQFEPEIPILQNKLHQSYISASQAFSDYINEFLIYVDSKVKTFDSIDPVQNPNQVKFDDVLSLFIQNRVEPTLDIDLLD